MNVEDITDIPAPFFPEHLTRYLAGDFSDFVHHFPELSSISSYADKRSFSKEKRQILVKVVKQQYSNIGGSHAAVADNITALLDPETFTLTTGQQVHVLGGPMFFMSKIMDVIALAKQMNETNDGKKYIPVFWLASEDHDFDEVKCVDVYGERFERETKNTGGPVGRYSTAGLSELIEQLRERLDDTEENKQYLAIREEAYTQFTTLAQATQRALDQIFGQQGLIVLDADDSHLKSLFADSMQKEITENKAYAALNEQTALLEKQGLQGQAIPKEINLFYMTDTFRKRIEDRSSLPELETHPEYFSPNVFLRTLYQETILPNLVYIAGPGEIKYRLQMKTMFEVYDMQMPVLLPRQLTQWLTEKNMIKIHESPLLLEDRFLVYDDFLLALQKTSINEYAEMEVLLDQRKVSVSRAEKDVTNKRTIDKQIAKSIKKIQEELATLERRMEAAKTQGIEESSSYAPLLKLHKKSFDIAKKFEKEQFVAGQVRLFDELRKTDWSYEVGGLKVIVS